LSWRLRLTRRAFSGAASHEPAICLPSDEVVKVQIAVPAIETASARRILLDDIDLVGKSLLKISCICDTNRKQ